MNIKKILTLFMLFLIFLSCGITTYIYLLPPLDTTASTTGFIIVTSPQERTDINGGIELYYKIYPDRPDIDDLYNNDIDYLEDVSISSIKSSLESRGYTTIVRDTDQEDMHIPPLIPLSKAEWVSQIRIDVDFSSEPSIYKDGDIIYLRRNVYDGDEKEYKKFFENYDYENDKDLSGIKNEANSHYNIGLIAVTYSNYEFEAIYSEIAQLGYIFI